MQIVHTFYLSSFSASYDRTTVYKSLRRFLFQIRQFLLWLANNLYFFVDVLPGIQNLTEIKCKTKKGDESGTVFKKIDNTA